MFVPGKLNQCECESGQDLHVWSTDQVLPSRVGSWPCPQTSISWEGLLGTNTSLLEIFINYGHLSFLNIGLWSYVMDGL